MRIISGSARGRKLAEFPGRSIRPTPDRVREAIFSILFSLRGSLAGSRVLDLFAGTGAMGIEALSRGSQEAWLIDKDRRAAGVIQQNLESCQLATAGRVITAELPDWLGRLPGPGVFDLVFLDPPYNMGLAQSTLEMLALHPELCSERLIVVAETDAKEQLAERYGILMRYDQRQYGTTRIHIYNVDKEGKH